MALLCGVLLIIGCQKKVLQQKAMEESKEFYDYISAGLDVDEEYRIKSLNLNPHVKKTKNGLTCTTIYLNGETVDNLKLKHKGLVKNILRMKHLLKQRGENLFTKR